MIPKRIKYILLLLSTSSVLGGTTGCSLDKVVAVDQPQLGGVVDQNIVESYEGARAAYYSAVGKLARAMSSTSFYVAQFTDELATVPTRVADIIETRGGGSSAGNNVVVVGPYTALQMARIQAQQAGDLLRRFAGERGRAMLAHTYAIRAYTIILFGELFCSGIPLTSAPYGGELIYTRGYTREELFEHALAVLDTGETINTDSLPVLTLLRVARGRALLNLGRYSEAAEAVAAVRTEDDMTLAFDRSGVASGTPGDFWTTDSNTVRFTVINGKGVNGLHWLANRAQEQDPRVPVTMDPSDTAFAYPIRQMKFPPGPITFSIASGIEARLIEAEAQLYAQSSEWLEILNALRQRTGVLQDTTDPGTANARVDLLFRERAFWFYLSGRRLGDLRRLIRQYDRLPTQVFPIGLSEGIRPVVYGDQYVFFPEPMNGGAEVERNPLYGGCLDWNP